MISIRLPDEIELRLGQEAKRLQRPKSEIAREAIIDYLRRLARDRFLDEIARAARARGDSEALELAAEALPLDNEALALGEDAGVREPRARYRAGKRKKR